MENFSLLGAAAATVSSAPENAEIDNRFGLRREIVSLRLPNRSAVALTLPQGVLGHSVTRAKSCASRPGSSARSRSCALILEYLRNGNG